MKEDRFGAFIDDGMNKEPTGNGILDGLSFAAKDIFAVRGHTNSAGNPTWKATHRPAEGNAPVIDALLKNGAELRGMTVTDELMYSLKGDNIHFPPVINPRFPQAYTGGSSSGSAAAVAGGLTDFAIGTDTGGSVRIPSAYCGLFGMRPTHGSISTDGVVALAPSFDTVGWMARSAAVLEKVGRCLLPEQEQGDYRRFYRVNEAWDLVRSSSAGEAFSRAAARLFPEKTLQDYPLPGVTLPELAETFRILQGWEAWQSHGQWIQTDHPHFGKDIADHFSAASQVKKDAAYRRATVVKTRFAREMSRFLDRDAVLVLPTTYGPAPLRGISFAEGENIRAQTMKLSCIAGVSGLPQLTIPIVDRNHLLGLSLISGRGTDRRLLTFACRLTAN
ncbi:MAG: amidase [Sporolactobacillus sp.]|jgi:amidase|nr:amidase [Sporolactobacillus sp.]